jgi:hypothetical protein
MKLFVHVLKNDGTKGYGQRRLENSENHQLIAESCRQVLNDMKRNGKIQDYSVEIKEG